MHPQHKLLQNEHLVPGHAVPLEELLRDLIGLAVRALPRLVDPVDRDDDRQEDAEPGHEVHPLRVLATGAEVDEEEQGDDGPDAGDPNDFVHALPEAGHLFETLGRPVLVPEGSSESLAPKCFSPC